MGNNVGALRQMRDSWKPQRQRQLYSQQTAVWSELERENRLKLPNCRKISLTKSEINNY